MGSDCCKTSSAPENDANMLTKEPVNELTKPTIIDTPNQKDIAKTVKTESQKYEPFQFKINNDDYFSIEGMSQKNPQKIMFSTTKESYLALNDIKPLKNLTIQTLVDNEIQAKPNPGEFIQKDLFGPNNIQGVCLQNSVFFSGDSNGETAFNFLYHSILKSGKILSEKKKNQAFINFISENKFDERNSVNYDAFFDFLNNNWINTAALQNFKVILLNDFSVTSNSKFLDNLISIISKLKSISLQSIELGLKTYNEDPKKPSLKELAIFKAIKTVLLGKEQDLETFTLALHTDDNQNKLLFEVSEFLKKTEKLTTFNLFLRLLTSSANIDQFSEALIPKLPKITNFSIGLFSNEENVAANISDDNMQVLLDCCKKLLPSNLNSFSFFVSTNKGVLDITLSTMLDMTVNKTFGEYNLALEGKYKNKNDVGELIRSKIKKKNNSADIGMITLDS